MRWVCMCWARKNFSKEQDVLWFYSKHMCAGRVGDSNKKIPMKELMVLYPKTEGLGRKEKHPIPRDPVLSGLCIYNVFYSWYTHNVRLGVLKFSRYFTGPYHYATIKTRSQGQWEGTAGKSYLPRSLMNWVWFQSHTHTRTSDKWIHK